MCKYVYKIYVNGALNSVRPPFKYCGPTLTAKRSKFMQLVVLYNASRLSGGHGLDFCFC